MNKTKLSVIALAIVATLVSCSNDNDAANNASSEYINNVRVTVEDFKPETSTSRTSYTVDNTGFHFSWAEGDALGVYPVGGDQVKFPISSGGGSKTASFNGGSWKLRSNFKYAAYYPFSKANYTIAETALPVSYTGQTQNGNNSTAHVGAYDYLACAASQPDANGDVDLNMKQLGAFLRLQLTMPKADTYSSVVLESDGAKFVTKGKFDLTKSTPAITATATSSTYTINLTNVSTTAAKQVVTVYALVAPANLSAANIKITVHGAGQTTYVKTVTGKNFQAGYAYNIAIGTFPSGTNASGQDVNWEEGSTSETKENGHEYVDLGLSVKWATMNVGATEVAGSKKNSHTGKLDCYGEYYAWGETTPKDSYDFSNLKYCSDPNYFTFSKYVVSNDYGTVDNKITLEFIDDAARTNWGGTWRMPTTTEQTELRNNCYWEWTTSYNNSGVKGYIVYKVKNTSDKGKIKNSNSITTTSTSYSLGDTHIFLPAAAGYRYQSEFQQVSSYGFGCYWSSSLYTITKYQNDTYTACSIYLGSSIYDSSDQNRCCGMSIRAVCP